MKKILLTVTFFTSLTLFSGCATNNKTLPYQGQSPEYIYAKGHESVQNENYTQAIQTFKSLNSQYPFEEYTELGNLDLIYAYYQNNESAMALALANQFIRTYPNSTQLAYVFYMMGVVNFDNGRSFLQRHLPYNMSQHDPNSYIQAFYDLKRSVSLDPNSHFAKDAMRRMIYINNIIGEYNYRIAKFYFIHKAYVAAINRAKIIVEKYPQSTSVENALVLMIKSYDSLKIPELAEKSMTVLKANYPENDYLKSLEHTAQSQTVLFK